MGEIADILVSCDRSWQKQGFTSLYGAVSVIAHETGKVLDLHVTSKECQGCWLWEGIEQTPECVIWKHKHQCEKNYEGSSGGIEPHGMSILFNRSLPEKIRYKQTKLLLRSSLTSLSSSLTTYWSRLHSIPGGRP